MQYSPWEEQVHTISNIFGVAIPDYCVTELPPKPWPITHAGEPLNLIMGSGASPMKIGLRSRGPRSAVENTMARWENANFDTFEKLFDFFDALWR